jgi:glycosyltransferase involved in cell wall biosynthesis
VNEKSVAIIGTRGYPSYYGGFETAVRKLAPYLADQGWAVTVYGRPGTTKTDDESVDPRVKTVVTRGLQTKSLSTLTYGFTSILHACWKKPDVALVMNVANGFWLPLLRARGIPSIVNVDGIEWDRAKWNWTAKTVFKGGARLTALFANELVVDAREIGRRWKLKFNRDGIFIPYGGDVPAILPLEQGLTHQGYVLVVARFVPENTIPEFLEAAKKIAANCPVVIVGSSGYGGEIEDQLRRLIADSKDIRWLGHVSDHQRLLSLWQHAAVYFHGHSVGGTNPALVQAMACGSPIVARDTVYNREVLGENAIFVEPHAASIAEGVYRSLHNPRAAGERAASARDSAAARYSWADICQSYDDALHQLARKGAYARNASRTPSPSAGA